MKELALVDRTLSKCANQAGRTLTLPLQRDPAKRINYHEAAVALSGEDHGIAKHLAVSLQFSSLSREQVETLGEHTGLPKHLKSYISGFDGALSEAEFGSPKFAYRVIFVPKTVNHPSQADQAITFVKADSELAKAVNATYTVVRETERPKWLPSAIVAKMKAEGFPKFGISQHTDLWMALDAKNPAKGFGVQIAKTWYWYESWVDRVRDHARDNAATYR